MKNTYFKVDVILRELDSNPNQLSKESGIRSDTVYNFCNNTIKRVNLDTLDNLLLGLNKIAKKKYIKRKIHIHDIIDYGKL